MAKKTALDEFKEKVVEVALAAAEEHDWCSVIDELLEKELGLGDLLPPEYVIEQLSSKRHKRWETRWSNRSLDDINDELDYRLKNIRNQFEYSNRVYQDWTYFERRIHADSDLDEIIKAVKKTHADLVAAQAKVKQPVADEWPHFRVRNSKTGEIVRHTNARGEDLPL